MPGLYRPLTVRVLAGGCRSLGCRLRPKATRLLSERHINPAATHSLGNTSSLELTSLRKNESGSTIRRRPGSWLGRAGGASSEPKTQSSNNNTPEEDLDTTDSGTEGHHAGGDPMDLQPPVDESSVVGWRTREEKPNVVDDARATMTTTKGEVTRRDGREATKEDGFISGVLSSMEETEEEQQQQGSFYRALRRTVIALKASPWLALWLLLAIAGTMLFVDEEGKGGLKQTVMSPLLLAGSILGVTTVKAKAGTASIGALSSAWGATWRASGAAGVISFYLRGVFAGKRIRVVPYPSNATPVSRMKQRMRTITVRSDSAQVLRERIARSNGLFAKDVRLYLWVTPGLFEFIPEDGDLTMVQETGFVVWARPGTRVPVQGTILPPAESALAGGGAQRQMEALLFDIPRMELSAEEEAALVRLAMKGHTGLLALHATFGSTSPSPDPQRMRRYATELLVDQPSDSSDGEG